MGTTAHWVHTVVPRFLAITFPIPVQIFSFKIYFQNDSLLCHFTLGFSWCSFPRSNFLENGKLEDCAFRTFSCSKNQLSCSIYSGIFTPEFKTEGSTWKVQISKKNCSGMVEAPPWWWVSTVSTGGSPPTGDYSLYFAVAAHWFQTGAPLMIHLPLKRGIFDLLCLIWTEIQSTSNNWVHQFHSKCCMYIYLHGKLIFRNSAPIMDWIGKLVLS